MSNITVKKESAVPQKAAASVTEWEPARLMRQFFGWDPFREMSPLLRNEPAAFSPAFEVKETKDGYTFKADLPGVKESDLEVTLTGNRLTVSGKRDAEKEERTDTYYAYERSYGGFSRSFTLPTDVDPAGIHADLRDGVMTLYVPRRPETMPKKIAVKSGSAPKS
jgi:HSP20 family protein